MKKVISLFLVLTSSCVVNAESDNSNTMSETDLTPYALVRGIRANLLPHVLSTDTYSALQEQNKFLVSFNGSFLHFINQETHLLNLTYTFSSGTSLCKVMKEISTKAPLVSSFRTSVTIYQSSIFSSEYLGKWETDKCLSERGFAAGDVLVFKYVD